MKFQSFVDLCCSTVFPLRQSNHDTSPPPPQADRPDLHLITDTAKIIPSCRPFPIPKFEHIGSIRNLPAKLMSVSGHIVLQISQNTKSKHTPMKKDSSSLNMPWILHFFHGHPKKSHPHWPIPYKYHLHGLAQGCQVLVEECKRAVPCTL